MTSMPDGYGEIKIPPWWMLTGVGSYLQFEFMWRESLESEKIYHFTENNTNFTYPRQQINYTQNCKSVLCFY